MSAESLERVLGGIVRDSLRELVRAELRAVLAEVTPMRNVGDGYLSVSGAARHASVAPGTIRAWIRAGRLPARRAGRVFRVGRSELERFLAGEPVVDGREIGQRASALLRERQAA